MITIKLRRFLQSKQDMSAAQGASSWSTWYAGVDLMKAMMSGKDRKSWKAPDK